MEIKRCMNCMEELSESNGICPACGTDNRKVEQIAYALRCGSILHERYLIGRMLGQGGFGITYIGMDMLLNIKVAIKEYFPMGMVARDSGDSSKLLWNPSQVSQSQRQSGYESFLKEARKMARIDEIPSIVRVRDLFLENETAYIVMDFVEGTTLKQKLSQEGVMAFSECLALLRPMMEDLAKVHKQGMIHRDISPDNIIIRKNGKVRLLDLGAAKDMTTAQDVSSQPVAKKGFSPFEQYRSGGNVGSWTDVYALCATIYYCITGKLLPDALDRIKHEEIDFPESLKEPLSAEAEEALKAGLAVWTEKRIQTVEELLHQLRAGESNLEAEEESESVPSPEPEELELEEESVLSSEAKEEAEPEEEPVASPEPEEKAEQISQPEADPLWLGLAKVKKSVWVALGVCVLVAVVIISIMGDSSGRESSEIAALSSTDQESNQGLNEESNADEGLDKEPTVDQEQEENTDKKGEDGKDLREKPNELPVMMADVLQDYSNEGNSTVLGSDLKRTQICTVTFLDTLENKAEDAWDVSKGQNGTVMAWTEKQGSGEYDLYIAGEGGVQAETCERLFKYYSNITEINFNGCFDTSQVTDMEYMFDGCENLERLDVSGFDTSQVTDMGGMFERCKNLGQLDVSNFDTSQVTDMEYMFDGCENLERLDVSGFDTSQVTNMEFMFSSCENLKEIDVSSFDTSQVTSMLCMFFCCDSLSQLDVSSFDTSRVTSMSDMFYRCENLEQLYVSNFDTSQVTDMGGMFEECKNLGQLDVSNFDTSQVTDMEYMFDGCENLERLDVSGFDTSQVTNMGFMFGGCENLKEIDVSSFDTSQVTDMQSMFCNCWNMSTLDLSSFNTSQVTNMSYMFMGCNLKQLDVSNFNTSQVTSMSKMFASCDDLSQLDLSNFDMSNVQEKEDMFEGCPAKVTGI